MFYVFLVQDGQLMPDCISNNAGFKIRDGPLKLYKIGANGLVAELLEGTVFNGKFLED